MAEFYTDSKMSELLLKLAGNATVRATITADGEYMGSVYDFMDLACPTMSPSWTKVTWRNLIAQKSEFKDEIKFTMVFLKLEKLTLRNDKKIRNRKTPVMTLRGLQRLMMTLGGNVAAEFRHMRASSRDTPGPEAGGTEVRLVGDGMMRGGMHSLPIMPGPLTYTDNLPTDVNEYVID